eukprot:gene15646-33056_t
MTSNPSSANHNGSRFGGWRNESVSTIGLDGTAAVALRNPPTGGPGHVRSPHWFRTGDHRGGTTPMPDPSTIIGMTSRRHTHTRRPAGIITIAAIGLATLVGCGDDTSKETTGIPAPSSTSVDAAPSTEAPTTEAPSTEAPTTEAPRAPETTTTDPGESTSNGRGSVVDLRLQATVPLEEVQSFIEQIQLPGLTEAQFGMAIWRVTYETIGIDGRPTQASGTMIVPDGAIGPLPVVSDQHGTQTARLDPDAPPMANEIYSAGLLFATQGYLVVGADYLGLGVSDTLHPYYHAD